MPLTGTTTTTGTSGLGTPTANTIAPVSIDDGPLSAASPAPVASPTIAPTVDPRSGGKIAGYFGATTFTADAPGPESLPAQDSGTPARPINVAGTGSHTLVFTGATSTTVIFKDTVNGTTPALFYNFGASVGIQNFIDYSALVVHAALSSTGGVAAPAGTTISAEIVGGSGASLYDIRTPCTTTTTIATVITAASSLLSCPLPAYGQVQTTTAGGFVTPGAANVQIPTSVPFANPVASTSAIGQFVPAAGYTLYFVVTFPATPSATASYTLSIDNVYAIQ